MAKRLQFCTALLLSMSVFVTGCTVDVQDPNTQENDPSQPEDSSTTNTAPVIELMGEPVITIPLDTPFLDPGVLAMDAEDGDVTGAVYSNNMQVNTSVPGQYEITYRVSDSGNIQAAPVKRLVVVSEPMFELTVPGITSVDWITVGETGALLPIAQVKEGSELDLSLVPGKVVNIMAESENANATGSVHFLLTGPIEIERIEDNAPYAMASEKSHLNVAAGQFPVGDYTLVVTPYSKHQASGEAGIPYIVNFTVKATMPAGAPEIVVVANGDSYTYGSGSDMQPGQVKAVSENDVYDAGAEFKITKAPSHGSARMFDLGFFTYTPKPDFSGTDSFTYQIVQAGKTASATVSLKVEGASVATTSGFTVIKPSADSRLVYVSNSAGSDANTCLSEASPCKTIKAGLAKMRNGYPDHLYMKRGDVWRDQTLNNLTSGRSSKEPAVIAFYGQSGKRPKIEVASTSSINKGQIQFVHFIGLEISAYKMDPSNPSFTGVNGGNIVMLGGKENLLFEDNIFNHVEIIVQAWDGGVPKNLTFRRNIWTGYYYSKSSFDRNSRPSNMYMDGVDGLTIEENVFDRGGWNPQVSGAGANMYNHNIYLQASVNGERVTLRNNIITRASSHGAQLRAGGLAEDNFFGRNSVGLLIGYNVEPLKTGVKAHAINNVASEGSSMVKGKDACTGVNLCTPAVWGIQFDIHGDADWQAHGNIASSTSPEDAQWQAKYRSLMKNALPGLADPAAKSSNNIAWRWQSDEEGGPDSAYPDPGRTLGKYNQSLGGANSFDEFMDRVKNRSLQQWDERYTAKSINKYIRAGFGR